jgi:hypothetical protein
LFQYAEPGIRFPKCDEHADDVIYAFPYTNDTGIHASRRLSKQIKWLNLLYIPLDR